MIIKERLQELIKQGATIYSKQDERLEKIILNSNFDLITHFEWSNKCFYGRYNKNTISYSYYDLEVLFETKEDALWELEMSATLTETLKMPKWEDIEFDEIGYYIKMFHMRHNYDFFGKLMITKEKIYVEEMVIGYQKKLYFEKLRNKENYIEACKLCLKLFKGER